MPEGIMENLQYPEFRILYKVQTLHLLLIQSLVEPADCPGKEHKPENQKCEILRPENMEANPLQKDASDDHEEVP